MEEKKRNYNSKSKGNFQPKNSNNKGQRPNSNPNSNPNPNSSQTKSQRPKKVHQPSNPQAQQSQRPQRKRRVAVDRSVEVVVVSNVIGRFYYENPRMATIIDLHHIGDEEYVTVGDLRTIINSSRKILEGFQLLITEVIDNQYDLEDVLIFLGLDQKYQEYFSLNKGSDGVAHVEDIKDFLMNTPAKAFEKIMESIDPKLRTRIIESAVTLFKLKEFGDYNKMRIIEKYVHDDLFADAEESEVDTDIYV